MTRSSAAYGQFVATRPWVALAAIVAVTVVAIFGLSLTADASCCH